MSQTVEREWHDAGDARVSEQRVVEHGAAPEVAATPPTPPLRHVILRHLPYFLVVAQEQHFHRAATILNVTQSALSRRIQALEAELGVVLFNRGQRGVTLTEAGRIFYEESKPILSEFERAVGRVRAVVRGEEGRLRIAINEGAVRSPAVSTALRDYRRLLPRVKLDIMPMLTSEQLDGLRNQSIDLGILYDLAGIDLPEAQFAHHLIEEEPMVLALPNDHPLATRDLKIEDLANEPLTWPSRDRGRYLHDAMIAAFQASGLSPIMSMEVLTAETTVNLAAAGLGMGFVGQRQHVPPTVALKPVLGFDVALKLQLVWQRNNRLPSLRPLLELLGAA
ncbi:LysR family transcriptional regulator [Sphingomonas crocodyli]|nr:LysR family transcriptional regulator [Sphingomonas crocodyli]